MADDLQCGKGFDCQWSCFPCENVPTDHWHLPWELSSMICAQAGGVGSFSGCYPFCTEVQMREAHDERQRVCKQQRDAWFKEQTDETEILSNCISAADHCGAHLTKAERQKREEAVWERWRLRRDKVTVSQVTSRSQVFAQVPNQVKSPKLWILSSNKSSAQIINAFYLLFITLRQEDNVTHSFVVCPLTWLDAVECF